MFEAKESLYNLLPLIPKIMPKSVQPTTITISCHTRVQAEPGIKYIAAIKPDISTAIIPTQYACLTRYGLFKSAFFFRKTTNERETIQNIVSIKTETESNKKPVVPLWKFTGFCFWLFLFSPKFAHQSGTQNQYSAQRTPQADVFVEQRS